MSTQTTTIDSREPHKSTMLLNASVAVVLGIVLALLIVNRWLAFEVEEGPDGTSVILLSPFQNFALRKTPMGNQSLVLAVYPASKPEEQASLDWIGEPGAPTRRRRQLTVLTYKSEASLEQVGSWYQKVLEPTFRRSNGWPPAGRDQPSTWMRGVESQPLPEAIIFHQDLPYRSRGVLLLPKATGRGSEIKLYDYMEGPA